MIHVFRNISHCSFFEETDIISYFASGGLSGLAFWFLYLRGRKERFGVSMAREFGGICAGFRSMAITMFNFAIALAMVSGERKMKLETARLDGEGGSDGLNLIRGALNFLWQSDRTGYHHVWPVSYNKNLYTSLFM